MLGIVIVLILVWGALAGRLDIPTLGTGIVASCLVLLAERRLFPGARPFFPRPFCRPVELVRLIISLAGRIALSTLHTSRLVLFGGEESRIVALPIRVRAPLARLILLNAITLAPSTISLLIERDLLYIHWLSLRDRTGDPRRIKDKTEDEIAALFGERGVGRG